MSNKEFNNFSFDNESEFEDIVSSSKVESNEVYSLSDFSGKGRYAKKPRGFWSKVSVWWKNRKTWEKSAMISTTAVLLIIAIFMGIFFNLFDYNYNEIETDDLGFEDVIDDKIVNVALFGIDTRNTDSFKGNSDSIMILSLNTKTKKVKVISVMRDSLVPITYNGKTTYSKINSAYSKGGPELAIKTLNTIFDLDISEYATVNFFGMVDIIDAVGGIEAELTSDEVKPASQFLYGLNACIKEICEQLGESPSKHYITKPGKHHLNGIQAVAYSRIRYVANIWGTNNDYGRTDRQRYVMEQLFNKAITLEKTQYVKLAKALMPCSETSLSYNEIINLAFAILLKNPTFEQARVPQQEYTMPSPNTKAGSVVYYDLDFAAKLIHALIYDEIKPDDYMAEHGVEKNDWYRKEVGIYSSSSSDSSGSDKDDDDSKPSDSEESKPQSSDTDSDKNNKDDDDDKNSKPDNSSDDKDETDKDGDDKSEEKPSDGTGEESPKEETPKDDTPQPDPQPDTDTQPDSEPPSQESQPPVGEGEEAE